jgi:glycosyltransferase involved in cell wall biosynthesis
VNSKYLHIVTHDVPYPADYGGVVDCFNMIKWLHKTGIKIHLHCFFKNRPEQKELEKYCETVEYYKRKKIAGISLVLPFIISSRRDNRLLKNLQKDKVAILFYGTHCTYNLYKNRLNDRQVFLRLLNIEHIYYDYLAKHESYFFKKLYYNIEAKLLKKYEANIANKATVFTISTQDTAIYQQLYHPKNIHFLPAFLPQDYVHSKIGKGSYCLYQGNLSVNENEKAALWLTENVFITLKIPLIIAGKNPSEKLKEIAKNYNNVSIVESPTDENMQLLIANAQINILPSFNNTGIKLKLFNALFNGRHCLVNLAGVDGSGLNELCNIGETTEEFKKEVLFLFDKPFAETAMQRRGAALKKLYNNEANAFFIRDAIH